MSNDKIKPCPFCGSRKIEFSTKVADTRRNKYYVSMYCKDCHCYGSRSIVSSSRRYFLDDNPENKKIAIENWNRRSV